MLSDLERAAVEWTKLEDDADDLAERYGGAADAFQDFRNADRAARMAGIRVKTLARAAMAKETER